MAMAMAAMELRSQLLVTVTLLLIFSFSFHAHASIVLTKVDRKIDLTSHIVRTITSLKVENGGSKPLSEILFALPSNQANSLSFIGASTSEGKGKNKASPVGLTVKPAQLESTADDVVLFSVLLKKDLKPGESAGVDIYTVFTHLLKPFPAEIAQSDAQLVLYHDSAYVLSPYPIKVQTTFLKVPRGRIESYTKVDPVKSVDFELRYGPYENIPAFSSLPITVHYENNKPFVVVEELEREIEISNWGNIYITENYHILHDGARHKGSFSRLDYQARPAASGVASLRQLLARLPPHAHSVYYRDEIGNVSTSHLRSDNKKTELELEPRYPLFGGWHVTFTIGYGVPLQDFVFRTSDGRRYLKYSFGCPLHDVEVKNLVLKVVLPEGSKDPSVQVPFPVQQSQEVKYSYLDTVGRTVVVLAKKNVVQEHNILFEVYFRFNSIAMLVEPLMLVTGFFLFFLACIAYAHLDFSISKSSASYQARIQREEIVDAIQRLQSIMNLRRLNVSEKLESSLRDLARTGDIQSCKAVRKSADAILKDTTKDLKAIHDSLQSSSRSSHVLPKVEILIVKEKEKQDKLLQKHSLTVELYERKLSSKEIDNRIAPHQQRILVLKQEVEDLLESLDDF